MKKKLTYKESQFCKQYLLCGRNATKAAKNAGYSQKTANVIGHENLTKPYIQEEIQRLRGNIEETTGLSKEMVVREHMKMAFNSIAHFHNTWIERKDFEKLTDDQKACISEIQTRMTKKNIGSAIDTDVVDVEEVRIKLFDRQKSLDSLGKLMGYEAATKSELTGANGSPLVPPVVQLTRAPRTGDDVAESEQQIKEKENI